MYLVMTEKSANKLNKNKGPYRLNKLLTVIWLLQEQFDNGRQKLELNLGRLIVETV